MATTPCCSLNGRYSSSCIPFRVCLLLPISHLSQPPTLVYFRVPYLITNTHLNMQTNQGYGLPRQKFVPLGEGYGSFPRALPTSKEDVDKNLGYCKVELSRLDSSLAWINSSVHVISVLVSTQVKRDAASRSPAETCSTPTGALRAYSGWHSNGCLWPRCPCSGAHFRHEGLTV